MSNGLFSRKLRTTAAGSAIPKPRYAQVRCKSLNKFVVPDSFRPHLGATSKSRRTSTPSKGDIKIQRWQKTGQPAENEGNAALGLQVQTTLDNTTEAGVYSAAGQEFGLSTEPVLQAFCGQPHHPHLSSFLKGYVTTTQMNLRAVELYWHAITNYLPEDPLTNTQIISPRHKMRHRSFTHASMKSRPGPDGINAATNHANLGWHMFLFTNTIYGARLLFDGTDLKFLPGPAAIWRHRLWAGGSINLYRMFQPRLITSQTFHQVESPVDLRIVGTNKTPEKVFLTISKRFHALEGKIHPKMYNVDGVIHELKQEPSHSKLGVQINGPFLEEKYTLCFLRNPPNLSSPGSVSKVITPPSQPKFSFTLTPDRHLLFCWSSLSYNAHLIHLDTDFAKKEYGAKDLVVHGPLTLILILEWFQREITKYALGRELPRFHLQSIDYKNLAPLYVNEPMTLCTKPTKFQTPGTLAESWEVWVQKDLGDGLHSMAFKGTIKLRVETDRDAAKKGPQSLQPQQSDTSGSLLTDEDDTSEFKSPFF